MCLDRKAYIQHCIGIKHVPMVSCGHFETLDQTQSTLAHHLANIFPYLCDHPGVIPTSCIISCQTLICTAQIAWFSPRYMPHRSHGLQWVLPGNRKMQNLAWVHRPIYYTPTPYQALVQPNHWSFSWCCHQFPWSALLHTLLPTSMHPLHPIKNLPQL